MKACERMQLNVDWSPKVTEKFPELAVCIGTIKNIRATEENEHVRKLRKTAHDLVRSRFKAESLKDNLTVRAYRDFYWKLGIDPTKTRPSGEALLRRVLNGNEIPRISNIVDAYNLASMETIIPVSGFDQDLLNGPFQVRFAEPSESFTGIGIRKPMILDEKMLVLADMKQILCIYPYRDSDFTKINMQTQNAMIIGYGAPGITEEQLSDAIRKTLSYMTQVSEGIVETTRVFSSSSEYGKVFE